MNCVIPFTKEIKFNTNIAEVLSISLEHDYTVNDEELLGNFTISGEYKTHEVSVNREKFEFVLPFSVNLTCPIDEDSLDFAIEDFTYEVIDNSALKVNIEYSIKALELKREDLAFEDAEDTKEEAEAIIDEAISNTEEEIKEIDEAEEDDERVVAVPAMEETKEQVDTQATEDISKEEEVIMSTVSDTDDDFVTYHIHIMKENDTIETICSKYNTTQTTLENYNDIKNLTLGDKLVIPDIDE